MGFLPSLWAAHVQFVLPPALLLLLLLTLPQPSFIKGAITRLVSLCFDVRVHGVNVFGVLLSLSIAMFGVQAASLYSVTRDPANWQLEQLRMLDTQLGKGKRLEALATKAGKFRVERNFWLSACIFCIYWCLFRVHRLRVEILQLKGGKRN